MAYLRHFIGTRVDWLTDIFNRTRFVRRRADAFGLKGSIPLAERRETTSFHFILVPAKPLFEPVY
jgi:hypothetical protein